MQMADSNPKMAVRLGTVPPSSGYAWGLGRVNLRSGPASSEKSLARSFVSFFMSGMNKSELILFSCPSCRAKYKIVAIDCLGSWHHGKVTCLKCNALFPAGDERVVFKYTLVWPPSGEIKRR